MRTSLKDRNSVYILLMMHTSEQICPKYERNAQNGLKYFTRNCMLG